MEAVADIPAGAESPAPREPGVVPTFAEVLSKPDAMFISAKVVRGFVREYMLESVIGRMYKTALGLERFSIPTQFGNVVEIEAPPSDQIRAMSKLIDVGVPAQIGLVDEDGGVLPGVFALGPLELDTARQMAQGERYIPPPPVQSIAAAIDETLPPPDRSALPMEERVAAGEFIAVEVQEGVGFERESADVPPPPPVPITERNRLEQEILAKRRQRKNGGPKK